MTSEDWPFTSSVELDTKVLIGAGGLVGIVRTFTDRGEAVVELEGGQWIDCPVAILTPVAD